MWKKDYKRRRHVLLSHTTVRNEFYSETDNNLHNLINGNGQFYLQIEKLEYYQELSKFTIEKFIYGN